MAIKMKLKDYLQESPFADLEDFNNPSYDNRNRFNFDLRNSIIVKKYDKHDQDILDLDGKIVHIIRDNDIIE